MKCIGYSLILVLTTILGYGGYVSQYLSERTQLKPDEQMMRTNQASGWIESQSGYSDKDCLIYNGLISCGQMYKEDCVQVGKVSECIPVYSVGFCEFTLQ